MFMTAPMGAMQAVQPPQPVTPNAPLQVAPAAQRLLASAISGNTPALHPNPDRKTTSQTTPQTRTSAQVSIPVTAESLVWKEGATTTQALLASEQRGEPKRVALPNQAGFAALLLAQEDMAGIALPQNAAIADMFKRMAERRPQPPQAPVVPKGGEPAGETIKFAAPLSPAVNAVMRREVQGSVMAPRGAASYQQAIQRMQRTSEAETTAQDTAQEEESVDAL